MRKANIARLTILVIATVIYASGIAKAQGSKGLPLSALAGNWAGEGSATFSICYNSDFSSTVDCGSAAHVVFFSETLVFQGTVDKNGNSCYTIVVTDSPEFPNPATPANVFTFVQPVTSVSYDPITETGTSSFTSYNAGPGTFCNGAALVNTANAPISNSGTSTSVISQGGNRADSVIKTAVNSPVSDLGNYVGHSAQFRQ